MEYINTDCFLSQIDQTKKYCFILGAGASVSSGILSGYALAMKWLSEIKEAVPPGEDYTSEIERRIGLLANGKDYERFKDELYSPELRYSLSDYNAVCDLRFLGDKNAENRDLFTIMDGKLPFVGYYALANILTRTSSNLVITTNFDELVEIAIRDFTGKEPFPIILESMASYATETVTGRPKILKIHRDIKVGGYNREEETTIFHKEWQLPLEAIFAEYTPIVIGYAGTDNSLMSFLRNHRTNGMYWCHMMGTLPNSDVIELVEKNAGKMVEIIEFDHIICHIASILCGDTSLLKQIIGDPPRYEYSGYVAYRPNQALSAIHRNITSPEIRKQYQLALRKKTTPISYPALFRCAIAKHYSTKRKHQKAVKWFRRAADYELEHTGKSYGKARYNLGVSLQRAGWINESIRVYREFLGEECCEPGAVFFQLNALNNYAFSLLQTGDYAQAKTTVDQLLSCRRWDGAAYRILAIAEFALSNKTEALQALENAIECHEQENLAGDIARDLLCSGLISLSIGEYADARGKLQKARLIKTGDQKFETLVFQCMARAESDTSLPEDEIMDILLYRKG